MPGENLRTPTGELERTMDMFKALAHVQRLKIIGLLASRPAVVAEIADQLGLSTATASHHLRILRQAGLLSVESDQQYRQYRLEESRLKAVSKDLLHLENLRAGAGPFPEGAYADKVLRAFVQRGRLRAIPAQRKKREVVLDWLAGHFEAGRDYPEAEVNRIIERFHPDFCTLRRELIMTRRFTRQAGIYRKRATGRDDAP